MRKLFILLLIAGCASAHKINIGNTENDILKADENFSSVSASRGMNDAFLQYMDSSAVLLRANHYPIIGSDAQKFISENEDTDFTLTWKPLSAKVSAGGDLGYTFGIYTLVLKSKEPHLQSTYVTIWKKQKNGDWKFVLDAGNPGVAKINK